MSNLNSLFCDGFIGFGNEPEGLHSGLFVVRIPVSAAVAAASVTTEYDTGFNLQVGWVVLDCWLNVTALDAGETVDVGPSSNHSGDANGFIVQASLAALGFVYPDAVVTAGTTETYYSSNTRGALLCDYIVGTNAGSDFGLFHKKPYLVAVEQAVTFTLSTTDTAAFDIFLMIMDLTPTAAEVRETNVIETMAADA